MFYVVGGQGCLAMLNGKLRHFAMQAQLSIGASQIAYGAL
jgi:hypothetical protein